MRLYRLEDEVRVALGRRVRDWAKSGLLSADQGAALSTALATGLRRTGAMLRLGLAGFTAIAGAAAVGLVMLVTGARSEVSAAVTVTVVGAAALAAAVTIVRRFSLYRHGVEEALTIGAAGLFAAGAALLTSAIVDSRSGGVEWAVAMAAVAATGVVAYRRFGFQYAAVGALYATALLPAGFHDIDAEFRRLFAALVCVASYASASSRRRSATDDIGLADAEVLRAAAAAGLYLALNVVIVAGAFGRSVAGWFHWSSWAVVWLLPAAVGRTAVVERDPLLVRVALAMGLASLVTNKSYLGWPRQPWDPMLLGLVLVTVALGLRRWLSAGPDGERHGFTARPLVDSDLAAMQLASIATVAIQPTPTREIADPQDPTFSGGRSGGAGASHTF